MAQRGDSSVKTPSLRELYQEWQFIRVLGGRDHTNWQRFRQYMIERGAPDPGDEPPEECRGCSPFIGLD
jgi:hypothetical protein